MRPEHIQNIFTNDAFAECSAVETLDAYCAELEDRADALDSDKHEWLCESCNVIHRATRPGKFLQPCPDCKCDMHISSMNLRTIANLQRERNRLSGRVVELEGMNGVLGSMWRCGTCQGTWQMKPGVEQEPCPFCIVHHLATMEDGTPLYPGLIVFDNSSPKIVRAKVLNVGRQSAQCMAIDDDDQPVGVSFLTAGSVYLTQEAAEAAAKEDSDG